MTDAPHHGRNPPGASPTSGRISIAEAVALAQQHHARGELDQAEYLYQLVIGADAKNGDALSYLGLLRHQTGNNQEAVALMMRAVELHPTSAKFIYNLGKVHHTLGEIPQAITAYRRALEINPRQPEAHCNLGSALQQQGKLREALEQFQRGMSHCPGHAVLHSTYLCALNYLPQPDLPALFAAHRKFADIFEKPLKASAPRTVADAERTARPLRVGYLSPDFKRHSVAHFIEPVLAAHDRGKVQAFCYSNNPVADDVTQRIRNLSARWHVIAGQSDDDVASLIRKDGVDILVDLAGHTPMHRLLVFARRPAPVQATWLGYPNTTGLASMDYRITDARADPPGATEAFHTERLVRLPDCFACFQAPADAPEVSALPAAANRHITFGSFNNALKITPEVITLWSRILNRIAGSRIVLKYQGLDSRHMSGLIRGQFAEHGVAADRVEILGKDLMQSEHLQRYGLVDIALDPFPYNGTTTTLDALWMGVPVITLAGISHVGRVGVSQLTALSLPEWIAKDADDCVDIAARLAGDLNQLAALRAGLRERLRASPLMDAASFTRHLEQAYQAMWDEHRRTSNR